jgi:ABC-type phosphate transport system substrate-binding protein
MPRVQRSSSTGTRILVLLLVLAAAPQASAEPGVVVIVNVENPSRTLDRNTLIDVFLKKRSRWSGGVVIRPVDQARGAAVRRAFSEEVLGRSVAAVRIYWNRQVFSGRGVPPPELASDDEVVKYVANHPGAIGYVGGGVNLKGAGVRVVEVR